MLILISKFKLADLQTVKHDLNFTCLARTGSVVSLNRIGNRQSDQRLTYAIFDPKSRLM